jgi:hypothetical protein
LVGKEIPGTIQKVSCEPFEYTIKDTGEVISMEHRWEYFPEGVTPEEVEMRGVEKEAKELAELVNA